MGLLSGFYLLFLLKPNIYVTKSFDLTFKFSGESIPQATQVRDMNSNKT